MLVVNDKVTNELEFQIKGLESVKPNEANLFAHWFPSLVHHIW